MAEKVEVYACLRKAREHRGLSLSDVAAALHLNISIIEQIEAGNFTHSRLAPVFMRGYIRAYAKYLHLPPQMVDQIVNELESDPPLRRPTEKTENISTKNTSTFSHINIKKVLLYFIVVLLLAVIGIYWNSSAPISTESTPPQTITTEEKQTIPETIDNPPEVTATIPESTEPVESVESPPIPEESAAEPAPPAPAPEIEAIEPPQPVIAPVVAAPIKPPAPIKKAQNPPPATASSSIPVTDAQESL